MEATLKAHWNITILELTCRRRRCHTRRGGDIGVGRNGIGGRRGSAAVGRRGPNLGARRLRLRRASLSLSLGLRLSKGLLRGGHLLQLRLLRRVQRGGDLSLLGLLKLRQVLSLESRELKPHLKREKRRKGKVRVRSHKTLVNVAKERHSEYESNHGVSFLLEMKECPTHRRETADRKGISSKLIARKRLKKNVHYQNSRNMARSNRTSEGHSYPMRIRKSWLQ